MKIGAVIADTGITKTRGVVADDKAARAASIIKAFQDAGISEIVLVTAPGEKALRRKVSPLSVTFVEVPEGDSEMFAYVCAGLHFLEEKCSRVFLTPLHIPFFSARTLAGLLARPEALVIPSYEGQSGHPILIDDEEIPGILGYEGPEGLRGALRESKAVPFFVAVEDSGTRMEAESVDEYLELKQMYTAANIRVDTQVRFIQGEAAFDAAAAALLRQIDSLGSVREAAQKAGISYSKAWKLIAACEDMTSQEIVSRTHGGKNGGEASVTEYGKKLLAQYEDLEKKVWDYGLSLFPDLRTDLF